VIPDPEQPRRAFESSRLDDLCASIMEYGILQPLLVRELDLDAHGDMGYQVVAGGRRLAALRLAQEHCVDPTIRARLRRVPVVLTRSGEVRNRVLQLLENLQRADLAPMEEARAYQEIIDLDHSSPPALAERLHISAQTVRNRLRLLHDEVIADGVRRGALTVSAAQEAQKLADEGLAEVYKELRAGENVSVAQVQEIRARLAAAGVVNPRRKGHGGSPALAPLSEAAPSNPGAQPESLSLPVQGVPPSQMPAEQKLFVPEELESAPMASQLQSTARDSQQDARPVRTARPTFLRLQEIDAALRNLSLDQAGDDDEALVWLPVVRSIAKRAERLCDALERLAGRDMVAALPADNS